MNVCIENSKFKSGTTFVTGFTLGKEYEHKAIWMEGKSDDGYDIKAIATYEYRLGENFWTKKVELRSRNFDPCTSTGILIVKD